MSAHLIVARFILTAGCAYIAYGKTWNVMAHVPAVHRAEWR